MREEQIDRTDHSRTTSLSWRRQRQHCRGGRLACVSISPQEQARQILYVVIEERSAILQGCTVTRPLAKSWWQPQSLLMHWDSLFVMDLRLDGTDRVQLVHKEGKAAPSESEHGNLHCSGDTHSTDSTWTKKTGPNPRASLRNWILLTNHVRDRHTHSCPSNC